MAVFLQTRTHSVQHLFSHRGHTWVSGEDEELSEFCIIISSVFSHPLAIFSRWGPVNSQSLLTIPKCPMI